MALKEPAFGKDADHCRVVGAEPRFGEPDAQSGAAGGQVKTATETAIAGDSAGGGDAGDSDGSGRAHQFLDQHLGDGILDAGTQVAEGDGVFGKGRVLLEEVADGRFEPAETEIVVGVVEQRTGEIVRGGIAFGGQSIDVRAAGVGQAEELGGFVETLAGGIVERGAEEPVAEFAFDVDQHGMATADDQGDVRFEPVEVRLGWVAGDPRRVQMGFVVVDTDEGAVEGEGEALGGSGADHEGLGEAGTQRRGHGVDPGGFESGGAEGAPGDDREIAEMFTRGELGDDATVFGVELDLRSHEVDSDSTILDHGDAGFVAGRFEGEDAHGRGGGGGRGRGSAWCAEGQPRAVESPARIWRPRR